MASGFRDQYEGKRENEETVRMRKQLPIRFGWFHLNGFASYDTFRRMYLWCRYDIAFLVEFQWLELWRGIEIDRMIGGQTDVEEKIEMAIGDNANIANANASFLILRRIA
jgi:hypothetical protein